MVVRALARNGMIELRIETAAHGHTLVLGILTCLDSPDGRRAAHHCVFRSDLNTDSGALEH
jgi:hypothetical protein